MMTLEEGNELLQERLQLPYSSSGEDSDPENIQYPASSHVAIIDQCIENMSDFSIITVVLSLALGNAADAVEIMCVGFIMADFAEEDSSITSTDKEFLSAAVFMGMLFGGIISGYASDRVGRRPCLLACLGINFVAGLTSATVPNINTLILCRVIGGLGIGGSVPVCFSFGAEIFPNHSRGRLLSIVASFWMVGAIFTALIAWVMLGTDFHGNKIITGANWREFAVVCALPVLAALIMTYRYLPESPKFLMKRGRYHDMAHSLQALSGIRIDTTTISSLVESNRKLAILQESRGSGDASTLQILFGDSLTKTTISLMIIWFTLSFGSYGLGTWISLLFEDIGLSNPFGDTFIFALANLPGNVVSILYVEKFGRKNILVWGMVLSALSAVGFALDANNAVIVVTCAALFNAFSTAGWNSLDCLSVELFPTVVRTSAMGILAAAGRLGSIAAQFVNGSLESNIPLLLFVTSACMAAGGLMAFLLPQDKTGTALSDSEESLNQHRRVNNSDDNVMYSNINPLDVPRDSHVEL